MRNRIVALLLCCALASPALASESPTNRGALAARVRAEFVHAWKAYERHAHGYDELMPLSRTGKNWHGGHSLLMTPLSFRGIR